MKRILAVVAACLGLSACVVNDGYGYYDDYGSYSPYYSDRYYAAPTTRVYYSDYYGYRRPSVYNNYYYTQDGRRYDRNDRRYDRDRYHRDDRRVNNDKRRPTNNARPNRDDRPTINRPNRVERSQVQRPNRPSNINRGDRTPWWNERTPARSSLADRIGGRDRSDAR